MKRFLNHLFPRDGFGRWLTLFGLLNSLAMSIASAFIFLHDLHAVAYFYLVFALLSQFLVINGLLGSAIALVCLPLKRLLVKKAIATLLFTLALFIVIVNVNVYALYRFLLNGMVLNLLFGGALLNNLSFSFSMWVSIIASALGIIVLGLALNGISQPLAQRLPISTVKLLLGTLLLATSTQLVHGFAVAYNQLSITQQDRYIPWYQPGTMRKSLMKLGFKVKPATDISAQHTTFSGLDYPKHRLTCTTTKPMNIIMLVVDSLRADALTPAIMPNTSALQTQALYYTQHFSTGNATRYGIFGLMYGLTANYWQPMLPERRGTALFTDTQSYGYEHHIYGSAPLTSPEFDSIVFSQLQSPLTQGTHKTSDANDQEIADKFLHDLQQWDGQKPLFGFVFFDSPHFYSVPEAYQHSFEPMWARVNYLELNNQFSPKPFVNRYRASVQFDDHLIGSILDALRTKNQLNNTVIIIMGDHGQEFNDTHKNFWGHNSNFAKYQTRMPLVVYWPGQQPQTIDRTTSHTDIVPTLMHHALGCNNPTADFSSGYDLLSEIPEKRNLVFENWTERAIRQDDKLYVFDQFGKMSFVDDNYNPISTEKPVTQMLTQELAQLSQFMKK